MGDGMTHARAGSGRLPKFSTPPVVEVALSVQFESPVLAAPLLWRRWSQVDDQFPHVQEVPPVIPVIETFDQPPRTGGPHVELRVSSAPLPIRLWMMTSSKTELVQLQPDRFGYNWRKLSPKDQYPSYAVIRGKFSTQWTDFERFIAENKLERLAPVQCEVTYVNHIRSQGIWADHSEIQKVIPSLTPQLTEGFLPSPEAVRYAPSYLIPGADGTPFGRLHVAVNSVYLPEETEPIIYMQLTARAAPNEENLKGILQTLDVGHEWIVRGFATLTSSEMHDAWRRTQ